MGWMPSMSQWRSAHLLDPIPVYGAYPHAFIEYWIILVEKDDLIIGALWLDEPTLRPYVIAEISGVDHYPFVTQEMSQALAWEYARAHNYTINNASARLIYGIIDQPFWGFQRMDQSGWLYVGTHYFEVYENYTYYDLPQFPYP